MLHWWLHVNDSESVMFGGDDLMCCCHHDVLVCVVVKYWCVLWNLWWCISVCNIVVWYCYVLWWRLGVFCIDVLVSVILKYSCILVKYSNVSVMNWCLLWCCIGICYDDVFHCNIFEYVVEMYYCVVVMYCCVVGMNLLVCVVMMCCSEVLVYVMIMCVL